MDPVKLKFVTLPPAFLLFNSDFSRSDEVIEATTMCLVSYVQEVVSYFLKTSNLFSFSPKNPNLLPSLSGKPRPR